MALYGNQDGNAADKRLIRVQHKRLVRYRDVMKAAFDAITTGAPDVAARVLCDALKGDKED